MALDFPANPSDGQVFGSYTWDAAKGVWKAREESAPVATLSPTAPTDATAGDIWVNTSTGISFVYYDDGNTAQWMELLSSSVPAVSEIMPTGTVVQTARISAPNGWLLCEGQAVSRNAYASLYAAIGTLYGSGDGSTTFNVPNLQGRIPVGKNSGTFSALGATGGSETHTLTVTEMPSHTHIQNAHTHTQNSHNHTQDSHNHIQNPHTHVRQRGNDNNLGGGASQYGWQSIDDGYGDNAISTTTATNQATTATNQATTATNQNTTATNQNTGGSGAHNNIQPYIVLNYMIKV